MRKTKKTKSEINESRREIIRRAKEGKLVFPEAIRYIREALDLTQQEWANYLGMTRQQIIAIESGRANPTIETVNRMLRPFELKVGIVVKEEEENEQMKM